MSERICAPGGYVGWVDISRQICAATEAKAAGRNTVIWKPASSAVYAAHVLTQLIVGERAA